MNPLSDRSVFVESFRAAPRTLTDGDEDRLADGAFLNAVFAEIDAADDQADRPLATALLRREMRLRSEDRGDYDNLFCAAFLLALKRQLVDVLQIWETKTMDFDANIGIDVQLLVFCGVDATLDFLRSQRDGNAADAADYIADCKRSGDFDAMDGYAEAKRQYFGFVH